MDESTRGAAGGPNPVQQSLLLLSKRSLNMPLPQEQQKLVQGSPSFKLTQRALGTSSRSRHYNTTKACVTPSSDLQHITFLQNSETAIQQYNNTFFTQKSMAQTSRQYQVQAPNDPLLMRKMLQKGAYKDSWLSPSKLIISPLSLTTQSRKEPQKPAIQYKTARVSIDKSLYSSQGTLNSPSIMA